MTITHLRKFIMAAGLLSGISAHAQNNVGIGTSSPHSTAVLEIANPTNPLGSDKGLLIPRLTYAQRVAIASPSPAQGLIVYQTNTNASPASAEGIYYYDSGSGWTFMNPTGSDNLGNHIATKDLSLAGFNITNTGAITGTGATIVGGVVGLGVRADGGLNIGQNTPPLGSANNLAIGYQAMNGNNTGGNNTIVGVQAGAAGPSASFNSNAYFGYQSGLKATGSSNTYIGYQAGNSGTTPTGAQNVYVGASSGFANTTGGSNTFLGFFSGTANKDGLQNVFLGHSSGKTNISGISNTFVGYQSGNLNTASTNTFIGWTAGAANSTSPGVQYIGYQSGAASTGTLNQFLGYQSGKLNTTGSQNQFDGYQSGNFNIGASNNQFTGYQSGYNNNSAASGATSTQGINNHFDGNQSGYSNTTGNFNQFSGFQSGFSNVSGSQNLFIGYGSGASTSAGGAVATTCANSTFIGFQAGPVTDGLTNAAAIGYLARVNQSNSMVLGGVGAAAVNVGIGVTAPAYTLDVAGNAHFTGNVTVNSTVYTSDRRFKQDIQTLPNALSKLGKLRGVNYTFRQKEFPARNFPSGQQIGVIAQELEQVFPELVNTAADGYKAVNYAQLTPVLIEAIKELAAQNATLRQQVAEQQGRDAGQTAEIRTMQKQLARLLGEESGSASAKQ